MSVELFMKLLDEYIVLRVRGDNSVEDSIMREELKKRISKELIELIRRTK